jgi:hypothetical protein
MTKINIKKKYEQENIRSKIYSLLSRAILTIMRNASNNIETRTNKTYMTNITRIRGFDPVIGKEKKSASPKIREPFSAERLSESSLNLNEMNKDINYEDISNSRSNIG